jgi:GNAT superfamily N-acetyltransferase
VYSHDGGVPEIAVTPLDTSLWPSLRDLFEQGGDAKVCWCTFWRLTNAESSGLSADDRRAWLQQATAAATADGRTLPPGLVAQEDGRVLGWVSLAPRDDYNRLARSRTIPMIEGESVWSVICFVVDRAARGRGLSSMLLSAAVDYATDNDAAVLEAYPAVVPAGERIPTSATSLGVESLFLAAGFSRVAETSSSAAGCPRVVVRRHLT